MHDPAFGGVLVVYRRRGHYVDLRFERSVLQLFHKLSVLVVKSLVVLPVTEGNLRIVVTEHRNDYVSFVF